GGEGWRRFTGLGGSLQGVDPAGGGRVFPWYAGRGMGCRRRDNWALQQSRHSDRQSDRHANEKICVGRNGKADRQRAWKRYKKGGACGCCHVQEISCQRCKKISKSGGYAEEPSGVIENGPEAKLLKHQSDLRPRTRRRRSVLLSSVVVADGEVHRD